MKYHTCANEFSPDCLILSVSYSVTHRATGSNPIVKKGGMILLVQYYSTIISLSLLSSSTYLPKLYKCYPTNFGASHTLFGEKLTGQSLSLEERQKFSRCR